MPEDMRIAIVGAGVGGLAAGIALRRAGFDVRVYERAPAIAPVGFGLLIQPNGAKALHLLGLGPALERISPRLRAVVMRDEAGELLSDIETDPLEQATGLRPFPVARADLFGVLAEGFGLDRVTLGAECVGVEQSAEEATIHFADGRSATADLVVGGDGLRSVVRGHVVADAATRFLWAGFETLVPWRAEITPKDEFTFWIGDGRRAAAMPVAGDRLYAFFDFPPDAADVHEAPDWMAELRAIYGDWAPGVRALLDGVDPALLHPARYYDLDPIATYVNGRVVLIGDAAHATTPSLSQGASQAIEDAVVLAHYLQTTRLSLADSLARYDRERRERTQGIVLRAREMTQKITAVDEGATRAWKDGLRRGSRDYLGIAEEITLTGPMR
ncbi:MAG TPA: FAD-dependent monooxygenase [Conexibacter sp.]|nr:FAD-dependent monooxygenase [Conexibacter sp.]